MMTDQNRKTRVSKYGSLGSVPSDLEGADSCKVRLIADFFRSLATELIEISIC
jgi:hypothetical protein